MGGKQGTTLPLITHCPEVVTQPSKGAMQPHCAQKKTTAYQPLMISDPLDCRVSAGGV